MDFEGNTSRGSQYIKDAKGSLLRDMDHIHESVDTAVAQLFAQYLVASLDPNIVEELKV